MKRFPAKLQILVSLLFLFYCINAVFGQELEPRAYTNVPIGLNFVLAGYSYSAGGVLFDPAVPLDDANIKTHGMVYAYARSIKIGKMSGKIDAIFPYAWLSGTAYFKGEAVSREVSGLCDPRIRASVIFIGGPALPLSGFKDYKQNLVVGASLQTYFPVGQYDHTKMVNLGTNRFTIKPELGISKTINKVILEMAVAAQFFTENNDYYNGKSLRQAPIESIQGHINYSFRKGMWAAFNGTFYWGGQTTIDGVEGDNLQENSRLGLTFALPLNIRNSLKINLSTGTSTRTGSDFDAITFAWQYRWGAGLPK